MFHANNSLGIYHSYVRRIARETVLLSRKINDRSIPERIYKKIRWYMVEAVFMGEMLANLTGHELKKRDRESLVYLGAVMALFDVMVDDFRLSRERIDMILEHTFSDSGRPVPGSKTAIEKVYFVFLSGLKATIEKEQWSEISEHLAMIKMQMNSDEQYSKNVSEESVTSITVAKGGVSALICSAFLKQKSDSFTKAVYELGGFIQMMNDCQDIHKDTVAGIKTFVHFRNSFREIFEKLDKQRRITFDLIKSLDYPVRGRSVTLFDLTAMFIVISYKLQRYAEACNYTLDFKIIEEMERGKFRINPFSVRTITGCYKKIVSFDFENFNSAPDFRFE